MPEQWAFVTQHQLPPRRDVLGIARVPEQRLLVHGNMSADEDAQASFPAEHCTLAFSSDLEWQVAAAQPPDMLLDLEGSSRRSSRTPLSRLWCKGALLRKMVAARSTGSVPHAGSVPHE